MSLFGSRYKRNKTYHLRGYTAHYWPGGDGYGEGFYTTHEPWNGQLVAYEEHVHESEVHEVHHHGHHGHHHHGHESPFEGFLEGGESDDEVVAVGDFDGDGDFDRMESDGDVEDIDSGEEVYEEE